MMAPGNPVRQILRRILAYARNPLVVVLLLLAVGGITIAVLDYVERVEEGPMPPEWIKLAH